MIVTGEDPLESSVDVTIDAATIDTDNADRDAHIRSADFLDVEQFPTIDFRSTGPARRRTATRSSSTASSPCTG